MVPPMGDPEEIPNPSVDSVKLRWSSIRNPRESVDNIFYHLENPIDPEEIPNLRLDSVKLRWSTHRNLRESVGNILCEEATFYHLKYSINVKESFGLCDHSKNFFSSRNLG